jgi:hypothetical protein
LSSCHRIQLARQHDPLTSIGRQATGTSKQRMQVPVVPSVGGSLLQPGIVSLVPLPHFRTSTASAGLLVGGGHHHLRPSATYIQQTHHAFVRCTCPVMQCVFHAVDLGRAVRAESSVWAGLASLLNAVSIDSPIGDTVTDVLAGRPAGVAVVGYANKPG